MAVGDESESAPKGLFAKGETLPDWTALGFARDADTDLVEFGSPLAEVLRYDLYNVTIEGSLYDITSGGSVKRFHIVGTSESFNHQLRSLTGRIEATSNPAAGQAEQIHGRLACKKDNDMDFRMILGDYYANETDNPFLRDDMPYKTYFFCPRVDSFSAFVLDDSLSLLNGSHTATYYLSAFGAGKSSEVHIPVPSQDAVVPVWEPNHHRCLGNQSAVATFLLFNLTLKDGDYTYK
eukprot:gene14144-21670_t